MHYLKIHTVHHLDFLLRLKIALKPHYYRYQWQQKLVLVRISHHYNYAHGQAQFLCKLEFLNQPCYRDRDLGWLLYSA